MYTYIREPGKAGLACLSFFAFLELSHPRAGQREQLGLHWRLWASEYAYRAGFCIGDYGVH